MIKNILFFVIVSATITNTFATDASSLYSDDNHANVSFDVSMPIDASGYTLHGKNLTGGNIQFMDHGSYVAPFLAHETGDFETPTVTSLDNKPLIKTMIKYDAIKFINPTGINNFFIKVGTATRTQVVSDLDPHVLKNGSYTWQVPIFAVGTESDTVDHKSSNRQLMQVGTTGGPASTNAMYTQEFYLYSHSNGDAAIAEHPQNTARINEILPKPYTTNFTCHAHGIWGSGGADPFRTITDDCHGSSTTFPAVPNLDYEYGTFTLPTVHTPWDATPNDHCVLKGKSHAGCVNATIDSQFHYMAQKIRVPLKNNITIYAEFGSAYRSITPNNLRYMNNNVYLKNLIKPDEYLKKNYLPGGFMVPYFAVGYEFEKNGVHYSARYIYLPGQENGNRLAWRDASDTIIYATSISGNMKLLHAEIQKNFIDALNVIRQHPEVYNILGKHFFVEILKKNNLY